jgi:hypothetical protein
MDGCSLFALIACFKLSGLYLDGGLQLNDVGPFVESTTLIDSPNLSEPILVSKSDSYQARNPYGRLALGYQIEFKSITWSIEVAHLSSIETGRDRGVNSLALQARWYPFSR